MNKPTHPMNPNTGREIQINGVRFWNLLKRGYKYDEKLNRLYDTPLPPDNHRIRRSTFPSRECFLPAIAP